MKGSEGLVYVCMVVATGCQELVREHKRDKSKGQCRQMVCLAEKLQ